MLCCDPWVRDGNGFGLFVPYLNFLAPVHELPCDVRGGRELQFAQNARNGCVQNGVRDEDENLVSIQLVRDYLEGYYPFLPSFPKIRQSRLFTEEGDEQSPDHCLTNDAGFVSNHSLS